MFPGNENDLNERRMNIASLVDPDATDQDRRKQTIWPYEEMAGLARIGAWSIVLSTGDFEWSPQIYEILSIDRSFKPTEENQKMLFGSEKFLQTRSHLIEQVNAFGKVDTQVDFFTPDGMHRVCRLTARMDFLEEGSKLIGFLQDVTEEKMKDTRIAVTTRKLKSALELSGIGIWPINVDKNTFAFDEVCPEKFLVQKQIVRPLDEFLANLLPCDQQRVADEIMRVQRTGESMSTSWSREIGGQIRSFDVNMGREIGIDGGVEIIGVARESTKEKQLQMSLEAKSREAEAALKTQKDFVARMSHEIRTPMNGVIGMLEVLKRSELQHEQYKHVDVAISSARSLLHILNDVIDLSLLEAPQFRRVSEPFQLDRTISDIMALFRSAACEKGLNLSVEYSSSLPEWVAGDELRIRQILTNIVGNAVKFTNSGGVRIIVDFCQENQQIDIKVLDTGIGMAKEEIESAFDQFYQADTAITRRIGGVGLGLTITRQLVDLLDGEIHVRSRKLQGSEFRVILPASRASSPTIEVVNEPSLTTVPLKILAADDNPAMQKILSALLQPLGHDITIVGDGQAAVAAAATQDFDVILMDVMMPVMDGPTAARSIRQMGGRGGSVPIIAITANAMTGDREGYLSAGITDYLSKPIEVPLLLEALSRAAMATGKA